MKRCWCILVICMTLCLVGCKGVDTKKSDITSIDDLSGHSIGVQIGTTGEIFVSDYEGDEAGTKIERYNKGADAVNSLKNSKIDCVVIDSQPARAFVEKNPELSILDEPLAEEQYAMVVAKENKELTQNINQVLRVLKEDGTLDQIVDYYIGDNKSGKSYETPSGQEYPNGTLIMGTNAQFAPYEYYDNGKIVGIDVDLATAVADALGYELVINDMEFDAIIAAVQSGKVDIGVSGFTVTEERKKNIDFTDDYAGTEQVVIVKTGDAAGLSIKEQFVQSFVKENRYQYILNGLKNTLIISFFAVMIGIVLGFLVAIVRATHDKTGTLKILNGLCQLYLTIIRGTPTMVQLLIIYFVIFASMDISKMFVAILAFGINSGAYVAEIIRGGIMALDNGQFEGARSLGLTHMQTMCYVVLPQTFKNTLPALANEFIVLIKETSISGYIGLQDLTRGGDIIRGVTYQAFFPLIVVALIYLVLVVGLTAVVGKLERRLKKNER